MRIAYIALSGRGGTALYSGALATSIVQKQHDVLLVAPEHFDRRVVDTKVQYETVRSGETHTRVAINSFDPRMYRRVLRAVDSFNPDIVHFTLSHPWNMVLAHALRSRRLVFTVHDTSPHQGARWVLVNSAMQSYMYRAATWIVCLSNYSLRPLSRITGVAGKASVIPHPVFEHYRRYAPTNSCRDTILMLGRIEPYKGVGVFLSAVDRCADAFPHARFVLAGPGKLPKALSRHSGLTKTTFLNRVLGESEISEMLSRSIAVVLPYLDATQSGVVAAAYALDCPVIASEVGGLPEVVQHGYSGLLVPPSDDRTLCIAISKLLTDDSLVRTLRRGVRTLATSTLSWRHASQTYEQLYRDLVTAQVRQGENGRMSMNARFRTPPTVEADSSPAQGD